MLRYSITNITGDRGAGIALGAYKTQWNHLSLVDMDGRSASVIPDDRPLNPSGLHSTGTYFLAPEASEKDYLVATRFLRPLHPGRYVLTVQVHIPYVEEAETEESALTSNLGSDIVANHKTLTRNLVFPIIVSKANPAQLQAKAKALGQAVLDEKDGKKYTAYVDALFSMPEEEAFRGWEAVAAHSGPMGMETVADRLAHISSIRSADLLVGMLYSVAASPDETAYVSRKLSEIYNNGHTDLRAHLKSVVAKRGLEMPDVLLVPQATD